jgi:predicted dehydrogenase
VALDIGFIGAGSVALRHAETLREIPGVRVTAVADPSSEAASAFAERTGARVVPDTEALLAEQPGAAYVCVPPFAHGDPEDALLRAGVPFFVEKPVSLDLDTAERIAADVAERGIVTATGYHWRYLRATERAVEAHAAAPARLAIAVWLDKVPPPAWWLRRDLGGGQTIEQTTHVLDVLAHVLGDAEEIHAAASGYPDADIEAVTVGTIRFASGTLASLAATSLLTAKQRAGVELMGAGWHAEVVETPEDRAQAVARVDRDFVDAVRGEDNRIRAPYAEALRTHRLAWAVVRAAAGDAPVPS